MYKFITLLALVTLFSADAFTPNSSTTRRCMTPLMAVVDIDGESAFDSTIKNASGSLVVVDYSTTW